MRYRRHGVKREHSVIGDFGAVYERIARLPGVGGVIPGRIANNPTHHPGLVLKLETATGFKLLAKTTTSIQEVFLIARDGARETVRSGLAEFLTRKSAAPPSAGTEAGAQRPRAPASSRPGRRPKAGRARERTRTGWRNPGIVPNGPDRRDPVRYTAAWHAPGAAVGEGLAGATRRRLLLLRLRRARWRRRFGVPLRRAPRRPG